MADFLSVYGANALLDGTPAPTTFYAKGHVGNPGNTGIFNPAAETRRLPTPMGASSAGIILNSTSPSMTLAGATELWLYLTLWDDPTAGNCWWIVPLGAGIGITYQNTIRLPAGLLSLSFSRWGD